jgi:hypothetical protein
MAGRWTYPAELARALEALGLAPTAETPPAVTRDAVDALYRYELRRLRDRHRSQTLGGAHYVDQVIALRRKYWMLTLPLPAWEKICTEG